MAKINSNYDFFKDVLHNPTKIVAPMVDHSDLPFRMLTRRYGSDLVFTQMMNSNVIIQCKEYREELLSTCEEDRPLIIQLCGDNPKIMLEAAMYLQDKCDAIDINLGCPQGIARRGHYGAFLMEELDLLTNIVSTLVQGCKVPITCKSRIYKDFDQSIRLYETLVKAGASMLTIHGRTREEKGHEVGNADWETIRKIKQHFINQNIYIPIVANGGISNLQDFEECLRITGADGVMTSEAILENPAFFYTGCTSSNHNDEDIAPPSMLQLTEEYLELCQKYPGNSMRVVRSHVMKMMHRYFVLHEDLRDIAATAHSYDDFYRMLRLSKEKIGVDANYTQTWYHRHMNPTHIHAGRINHATATTLREKQYAKSLYCDDDILGCLFE